MATNSADIQFESALMSSKLIDEQQMRDAKEELERRALVGDKVSLADILVGRGVITSTIREHLEKTAQDLPKGLQTLGHYKLLKKLGQGGMGAVYLAEDTADNSKVAIKILPEKFAADAELLARFRRENKAAFRLRHENICVAYGEGEKDGVNYYTMEYCDGEPLDAIQKRLGKVPLKTALDILIQVARGLQYAHDNGIIHRDIKPANIFLSSAGVVKILDMGLSKDIEADDLSFNTASGTVLGTAHYLSPEQAKGEKQIDGRADIYSLGATLYSLVTGTTPFKGATQALVMMKHISEPLPNPKDLAKDLPDDAVAFIQKLMAKEPADRYQNCTEVINEIERIRATLPKEAAPEPGSVIVALPTDETRTGVKRPVQDRVPAAEATKVATPASAPAPVAEMKPVAPIQPQASPAKSRAPLFAAGVVVAALIVGGVWFATRGKGTPGEAGTPVAAKEEKPSVAPTAEKAAPPPVEQHVLKVDFEGVDLGKLATRRPEFLSIDTVEGHGKVLHMRASPSAGDAAWVDIPVDLAAIRGKMVECRWAARAVNPAKSGQGSIAIHWASPQQGLVSCKPMPIIPGIGEWKSLAFKYPMPAEATNAFVRISRDDPGGGDLYVDSVTIDNAK